MRASVQWMTIMIAACRGDSSVGMWTKKIKSYVCGCLLFSTLLLQWIHLLQDKNRLHFWRFQFRLFLWHFGVHPCKWVMWAFFCCRKLNSFFFCAFLAKKQAHQTKQNFGGKAARFSTPFLWKCSHTNDSTCRFTAVIYSFLLLKPAENGFLPYGWELTYSKNCRKCFQLSKNNERYILTKPKKMI